MKKFYERADMPINPLEARNLEFGKLIKGFDVRNYDYIEDTPHPTVEGRSFL